MELKDSIKDYLLIILNFVALVLIALSASRLLKLDIRISTTLAILALFLDSVKQINEKHKAKISDADSELTDGKIDEIKEYLIKKNAVLEDKQKVMSEFLKKGIVKEDDIIENLNMRSFIIFYHFNRKLKPELKPYLQDGKKAINKVLKLFGFVPVGYGHGASFFHIRSTEDLPKELNDITYFTTAISKEIRRDWNVMWSNIEKTNKALYIKYEKQEEKDKAVNLIYLLGKVYPSNLSVGYLNFSSFDRDFLAYYARFTDCKTVNIDLDKLRDLISLASLDLFINSIDDKKDRRKISEKEREIKTELGIERLDEYDKKKVEQWARALTKVVLFDNKKAWDYAKSITESTNKYCPIIREFTE